MNIGRPKALKILSMRENYLKQGGPWAGRSLKRIKGISSLSSSRLSIVTRTSVFNKRQLAKKAAANHPLPSMLEKRVTPRVWRCCRQVYVSKDPDDCLVNLVKYYTRLTSHEQHRDSFNLAKASRYDRQRDRHSGRCLSVCLLLR